MRSSETVCGKKGFAKVGHIFVALAIIAGFQIHNSTASVGNQNSSDEKSEVKLKSIGSLAFGVNGILFVADPLDATIYAISTADSKTDGKKNAIDVKNVSEKIAGMVGVEKGQVRINDVAVNPENGDAYLSATRGNGDSALGLLFKVSASDSAISEVDLSGVKSTKTVIPNPAKSSSGRRGNQRMNTITDLSFVDGELYVAGLSNEEFASSLRVVPFPFEKSAKSSSVEIYHGAHGKFETRSPIRTFAAYDIAGETNLLAAYTCTPLVRIPLSSLEPDSKVKGTTVAELGNRNVPLDMFCYKKEGKDFVLMANTSRGVMKISLDDLEQQVGITSRISGTAGLKYDTIKDWTGVMQLDRFDEKRALILVRDDQKNFHLKTVDLP